MASRKKKKIKNQNFFDYTLLFVVIFLILFGLVMIYSTSSYDAANDFDGDSTYYLRKQLFATILGVFVLAATTLIDYHFWERFAVPGLLVSFVLILLVLTPLGIEVNGARRWIKIGPLSLQPAEVVKIEVILFCATLINKMNKNGLAP